ncbi:MAG: alkaline phosphatase family protein [Flavobacteriales bacterium]|nr:alkaline phosphatase family protein [Flavobacteriales bacterium]
MAYAASIEAAAHVAMAAGEWDATMIFFDAIDTVGHHFMQFRPPRMAHVSDREVRLYGDVMDRVYEWHDEALGRLLDRAGADTTVLLLSDHGFHSGANRPNLKGLPPERRMELESSWHRPYGVLVASGPGVVPGALCGPCSVLDLTPTSLALLGAAMGEDMDGRVLREILEPSVATTRVPSWDHIEGDAGQHPADLQQDPFEATAAIQQLVDLGYLAALPEDARSQIDLVSRESRFNLAVVHMSGQRYAQAIPLFAALVAEQPSIARYGMCLVQCQNGNGAHADAVASARELLSKDPRSQEYRLLLAHSLALAGDIPSSLRESALMEKAAMDKPEFAASLAALAMVQGRYDEAVKHAGRVAATDPAQHSGAPRTGACRTGARPFRRSRRTCARRIGDHPGDPRSTPSIGCGTCLVRRSAERTTKHGHRPAVRPRCAGEPSLRCAAVRGSERS